MTRICVMIRGIRICARICMILNTHRDNARIVVKKGHFWAFLAFQKCGFVPLRSCASALLSRKLICIPFDSLTCWLQIAPIHIRNRLAVAEILPFSLRQPCIFDLKKCGFVPLTLRLIVVVFRERIAIV